ncbi:AAA family ATPase, partial [Crocosphaera chwakensis]
NVGRQLSQKLGIEFDDARTLHSLLKYRPGIDNKKNEERFLGRKLDPQQISELPDLIIVDEVSMVNEEMYDLLKELAQHSKKILLVGDNAQIRPVNEGRSKAFSDPTIKHRSQLTEVVRYSNQLGYLATALRTNQQQKKPLITSSSDQTVVGQNQQDWTNNILTHFTSEEFNKNPNYFQVYAYTNARVDELNNQIRQARFGNNAPEYVEGEIIVADDNGRDIDDTRSIYNGEELKVINANKLTSNLDENKFSTWLLTVQSVNDSSQTFDIKIIAKESQQAFSKKVKELDKAWKMETDRAKKREKYKKAQEFKQAYNYISYNYARTYHKAQGKTKTKVAIDQQNINDSFNKRIEQTKIEASRQDLIQQMQELTYVAATRASEQLFVYNNKAALILSQKPWYLPNEEWENSQSDINTNQKPELSSPDNSDQTSDVESNTNTNSYSSSSAIQIPPVPDEELEPADEDEYIPSIEELEDDYHTDFDPNDVPLPEDEYDDQIENDNSQTLDKNNIKPKPKVNSNHSSNKDNNQTSFIDISSKPVNMNYSLLLHGEDNKLPVDTTIDAMRGHGRTHTTRHFQPYKAYKFIEGDIAIAYSGNKENPDKQVAFLVGKQYQITDQMIRDPQYRQEWAEKEKHSVKELDKLTENKYKYEDNKGLWGLEITPLGDYKDGKIYSFDGEIDLTEDVVNKNYDQVLKQQSKVLPTFLEKSQTNNTSPKSQDNQDPLLDGSDIIKKILNKLADNSQNLEKLTEDSNQSETTVNIKIVFGRKTIFEGKSTDEEILLKGVSQEDLTYLEKALDLETGQTPSEFNRDLLIRFKGQEIFRLENGVVKLNHLQPQQIEIDIKTSEVKPNIKDIEQLDESETTVTTSSDIEETSEKELTNSNDIKDEITTEDKSQKFDSNNSNKSHYLETSANSTEENNVIEESEVKTNTENLVYNEKDNSEIENPELINSKSINSAQPESSNSSFQEVLDSLSTYLSPEFMPENIAIQQQRTEQVAPVLLALLQAKRLTDPDNFNWDENNKTLSYKGKQDIISWNGEQLSLTSHDGAVKMIAKADKTENQTKWKGQHLPLNSPGLSEKDVTKFTDYNLINSVKETLVNNSSNVSKVA